MKKKFLCLFLSVLIFSLTGCVKFNATMDIKKDKSMDYSIIYAVDTSIFGDTTPIEDEDKAELEKQGFTVNEYVDGNMKGYTISKNIKNIDSVSSTSAVDYDLSGIMENETSNYIFSVKKGFLKNTYSARFKFDSSESDLSGDLDGLDQSDEAIEDDSMDDVIVDTDDTTEIDVETDDDLDIDLDFDSDEMPDFSNALASSMDLSFNVKLPYAAISNNATSVSDGNKTLSWTLTSDSINSIDFSFELYNLTNILIVAGGALLFLIILIVIIVSVSKKGKGKKDNGTPVSTNEVPEINSVPVSNGNFSEQNFNQQLMSQMPQETLPQENVTPVSEPTPSAVLNVVFEGIEPAAPSVTPESSFIPQAPASQDVISTQQPAVQDVQDVFNSNFEFVDVNPTAAPVVNEVPTPAPAATPVVNEIPTPAPAAAPVVNEISTPAPAATPVVNEIPTPAPAAAPVVNEIPTPAPAATPAVNEIPTPVAPAAPVVNEIPTPAPTAEPVVNEIPTPTVTQENAQAVEDPFGGQSI